MRIIFSSIISWSIYNFRLSLLKSLRDDGHLIHTVASKDKYSHLLEKEGFFFSHISINNNSINPFNDLMLIMRYYKIYKEINPDVICHNAIKPNIYGTIAAGILGIPTLNNISGLGTLFIKKNVLTFFAKELYRFSQKKATKVFFQNYVDYNLFVTNNLVCKTKCEVIPGSGVDVERFKPDMINKNCNEFNFLFIGRLLKDKGIFEYVDAAKYIKKFHPKVVFNILGPFYKNNNTSIDETTLDFWVKEGIVNYLGESDEVEKVLSLADCVVLPSYREGLSKVLIESSSFGIPIITTDVPGCNDVVLNNITGFLCRVKDADDLANKMKNMINLPIIERVKMGQNARARAIEKFDERIVISKYKKAIFAIFNSL